MKKLFRKEYPDFCRAIDCMYADLRHRNPCILVKGSKGFRCKYSDGFVEECAYLDEYGNIESTNYIEPIVIICAKLKHLK